MDILNVTKIEGQELEKLISNAKSKDKFSKLVEIIELKTNVRGNELEVYKAEALEIQMQEEDDKQPTLFKGRQLVFSDKNSQVNILYREGENFEFPDGLEFNATLISKDLLKDKKSIFQVYFEGDLVTQEILVEDYEGDKLIDVTEETDGTITEQVWWTSNGCLPGGYQHCGGNCGYTGDYGGGKPINETDRCCVIHDDCYRSGITKCKCNNALVKCVKSHSTVASFGIVAYFGPKSC